MTLKEDIATHKNNPMDDVSQHGFDIASYIIAVILLGTKQISTKLGIQTEELVKVV